MELKQLFDNLWQQYTHESPAALDIYNLLLKNGEKVVNDHIAFRTFADSRVDVEHLEKFWLDLGYQVSGEYRFEAKKLSAKHYEHKTNPLEPKIFISQLEISEFSPFLQEQARMCSEQIPVKLSASPEILYSGRTWGEPDYAVYQQLLTESEYAAWLYVFGFRANHFTISINHLKQLGTLELINSFLQKNGFSLNSAGGEIKGSPDQLLEQSSTMATRVAVKFKQGEFYIANSFYEFAKRYPLPDGKLYQGFIAASADKLFESTNNIQM